jgi:hypothetical protein
VLAGVLSHPMESETDSTWEKMADALGAPIIPANVVYLIGVRWLRHRPLYN